MVALRRNTLGLIAFTIAAVACSAGSGPSGDGSDSDGDDSSRGTGGETGGGDGDGDGDNVILPGDGDGDGDGDGPPDDEYLDPPLTTCETPEDCCDKIEGCVSSDQFVCTSEGFCGEILGSCSMPSDCQGDSLCCTFPDCLPNAGDGVCIPGNVAPNTDCGEALLPGVFSPSVQCEWPGSQTVAEAPTSVLVMTTPLVADLPNRSGTVDALTPEGSSSEIVIVTTTSNSSVGGVIRIIDGQSCELKETISLDNVGSFTTPALADLDGDGDIEIAARLVSGGVVAYTWNPTTEQFEEMWKNPTGAALDAGLHWSGLSIHDLDDDGQPEVLADGGVYEGQTGLNLAPLNSAPVLGNGMVPTAADLDGDGVVELVAPADGTWVTNLQNWSGSDWTVSTPAHDTAAKGTHFAYADFGTQPDSAGSAFMAGVLDGVPEIVSDGGYGGTKVFVTEIKYGNLVMEADTGEGGGHPNIGDFDGDGVPEIGIAGGTELRVFDFECESGCTPDPWVRWKQSSQDSTSRQTSATLFDFDGDGSTEVVYADECYLRVYDGDDGTVLYSSYRNSGTWLESPLVADVDRDDNTEIVINNNVVVGCAAVDPIHPGIVCETDAECPATSTCADGYCRCTTDADCRGSETLAESGLSCADAVAPATPTAGQVCRAAHPGTGKTGIRILRDRLDRWVSSGSIWNQQNFTITNINTDGTIPRTSEWLDNWTQPGMNNYRQNVQGTAGAEAMPDITGAFASEDVCVTGSESAQIYLQATVCNRGDKGVGAALPATFYEGPVSDGKILCTSYTDGPVPTNSCKLVWCAVGSDAAGKDITIAVNDDGMGGRTTVECHADNNFDSITVDGCSEVVVR